MRQDTPVDALVKYARDMNVNAGRYANAHSQEVAVMIERAVLYVDLLEVEAGYWRESMLMPRST